jgi:hypothetical protein
LWKLYYIKGWLSANDILEIYIEEKKMNISEVEPKFAQKLVDTLRDILQDLSYTLPEHYQPRVSLLDANGRKKKRNAAANNWSPESGRIEIRFEATQLENEHISTGISLRNRAVTAALPATSANTDVHAAETELLKALDRAESKPGWNFVPLKKFRDEILPLEHCPSLSTDVEKRTALSTAIEKRLILTAKVQNPKAPQFPVTTIRLNRLMPEVKAALGQASSPELDFRPVEIHGEPLSATVLRERR